MASLDRHVGCWLDFEVTNAATVVLAIAPVRRVDERLSVSVDGVDLPVREHVGDHGTVHHVVESPTGHLRVAYEATAPAAVPGADDLTPTLDHEQLVYLRPSRYCPSDVLRGMAAFELGHLEPGPELLDAVGLWVASRLTYVGGSSGPLDTAVDSLLAGKGVCRDFTHLAITMLRALEVPARLVGVYAPGLSPMDFHAVVEAHVDGRWRILDATRMAPRQSLVRVATGRDAADTAFATVLGGDAELVSMEVAAVVEGDLPLDDHTELITLP